MAGGRGEGWLFDVVRPMESTSARGWRTDGRMGAGVWIVVAGEVLGAASPLPRSEAKGWFCRCPALRWMLLLLPLSLCQGCVRASPDQPRPTEILGFPAISLFFS